MYVGMTLPQSRRSHVTVGDREIYLTRQEHQIVEHLLLSRPRYVTRDELIQVLWPDPDLEPDYAENTVGAHICRARRKGVPITRLGYKMGYTV